MNIKRVYISIVLAALAWTGPASADLVARWTFNNNSNDQIGVLNWTLSGGATYSTDHKEGSASLQLDGVDDYAALPSSGLMSDAFTVKTVLLWFKPNALAGTQVIYDEGGSSNGLALRLREGVLEAVVKTNPNAFTVSTPLSGTSWSHAAVSFDNGLLKLYLNGALAGSTTASFTQVASHTNVSGLGARNGQDSFGGSATGDYFGGLIDDVQVYNEALSEATILQIKTVGLTWLAKARKPVPANGVTGITTPLFQWTAGDDAQWHNVYLGTSANLGPADLVASHLLTATYYHVAGLTPGATYWWRVDEIELDGTISTGDVWSFTYASKKAWQPAPSDSDPYTDLNPTLTWKAGLTGSFHDVYFGLDKTAVAAGTVGTFKGNQATTSYAPGPLQANTTYYWRVDEVDAAGSKEKGDVWSFKTLGTIAIADPNLVGWWTFDEGRGTRAVDWSGHGHHAAFNGTASPTWVSGYDGGALSFNGAATHDYLVTSYPGVTGTHSRSVTAWIKTAATGEILSWGENVAGQKWIFRVQTDNGNAGAIRVEVNGGYQVGWTDVRDNEWHHIAAVLASDGTPDATEIKLYVDGVEEASSAQLDEPINTINTGVVRIGESPWHNRPFTGLIDDVRVYDKTLTLEGIALALRVNPLRAWQPSPAHGSLTDIRAATPLTWTKGDGASKHDVYFGVDQAAVTTAGLSDKSGVYRGRVGTTSFTPAESIEWGKKYFWRVDEIGADGNVAAGVVWSFTVPDYLIVDNFEGYTDAEGSRIYETWVDGWTNGTGAVVGNLVAPFAERTIVSSGKQALPLDYNNINSPWYSEAQRTWNTPQNWTFNGTDALVVYFRGQPPAFLETAGTITLSAAGADIGGTSDEFRYAFKKLTGDGSIVVRVDSLTNTNTAAKAGVVIRETLDPGSRYAGVVITPGSGVLFQRRLSNAIAATVTTQTSVAVPRWLKLTRSGNTFTAQHSADGVTWTGLTGATGASSDTVVLAGTVYIGLAVTSHTTNVAGTAVFSNLATTGSVTGSWQTADIGVAQPGNAPASLYLAVGDSAGKTAVITNPDASAVFATTWTAWTIPLSSLTGVSATKVKTLTLGVGDRKNPVAGGAGRIYIDDLRITKGTPATGKATP
jgi:hypothetical protein